MDSVSLSGYQIFKVRGNKPERWPSSSHETRGDCATFEGGPTLASQPRKRRDCIQPKPQFKNSGGQLVYLVIIYSHIFDERLNDMNTIQTSRKQSFKEGQPTRWTNVSMKELVDDPKSHVSEGLESLESLIPRVMEIRVVHPTFITLERAMFRKAWSPSRA